MRAGIVVGDKDQRSHDARRAQTREAFLHEKFSNSFPMMCGRHREVINQAAAAIVPTEYRAHDRPVLFRYATKVRIAQKVSAYFLL
jgi:hypothetical protein